MKTGQKTGETKCQKRQEYTGYVRQKHENTKKNNFLDEAGCFKYKSNNKRITKDDGYRLITDRFSEGKMWTEEQ